MSRWTVIRLKFIKAETSNFACAMCTNWVGYMTDVDTKLTVVFMMPVPCVRMELAIWRMLRLNLQWCSWCRFHVYEWSWLYDGCWSRSGACCCWSAPQISVKQHKHQHRGMQKKKTQSNSICHPTAFRKKKKIHLLNW